MEDSFINKVVPEITSNEPDIKGQGDTVKTFVAINSELRKKNHETIARLSKDSPGNFLWNGAFLQLSNSKVESFFADRRTYVYQGKEILGRSGETGLAGGDQSSFRVTIQLPKE